MRLLAALLMVIGVTTAAQAQLPIDSVKGLAVDSTALNEKYVAPAQAGVPAGMASITTCNRGFPTKHFRSNEPLTELQAGILDAHESVHVKQLWPDSSGTCEQKLARMVSSKQALLAAEAPAYCAQIKYAAAHGGQDPATSAGQVTKALWLYFNKTKKGQLAEGDPGYMPPGDIAAALMNVCPINNQQ